MLVKYLDIEVLLKFACKNNFAFRMRRGKRNGVEEPLCAHNSADSSSPDPSSDSLNFAKIAGGEWPARRRYLPPTHRVLLNHSQPREERETNKGLLYLHRGFEQRFRRVCAVAASSSLRETSRRVSNRDIYLPTIARDLETKIHRSSRLRT